MNETKITAGLLRLATFIVSSALFLASFASNATVVAIHSLEEMSQRADVIAHVRVAEQVTEKIDGRIATYTGIEVIEGFKGAIKGETFRIYQMGGTFEGQTTKIAGAYTHKLGEEMVLFAMRHRGNLVSYGVGVGKFKVEYDGALQKVVEEIGDVVALRHKKDGTQYFETPTPREALALKDFKIKIHNAFKSKKSFKKTPSRNIRNSASSKMP